MMKYAVLSLLLSATACASSETSLARATASVTGADLDHVQIASVNRGLMDTTWTAKADGRSYKCSADDMIRRPVCSRR